MSDAKQRGALASATFREVRARYPEANDADVATIAAELHSANALAFDGGGSLRVSDTRIIEKLAPRLLELNGAVVGSTDEAKAARAMQNARSATPLRSVPRKPEQSLQEQIAELPKLHQNASDRAKAERAFIVAGIMRAHGYGDGGDAA